ncbi:MAG TPA: hypothetical protein VGD98_14035 [Ktedonobacteraceae bacterium]
MSSTPIEEKITRPQLLTVGTVSVEEQMLPSRLTEEVAAFPVAPAHSAANNQHGVKEPRESQSPIPLLPHNFARYARDPQQVEGTETTIQLPRRKIRQASGLAVDTGESEFTLRLSRKAIRHQQQLAQSQAARRLHTSQTGDTETTIQLHRHKIRQANEAALEASEAESTLRLPGKAIKSEYLQGQTAFTSKFPFRRSGGRAGLEYDLQMSSFDDTAYNDQDDEVMQHHETWQKIVAHKATVVMPAVSSTRTAHKKRRFSLLRHRAARSFFWLSTLVLIAMLLSGAFGLAASFGRTVKKAVPNPPPALQALPAIIALGGIVTLHGTHLTPGGDIDLSRDQNIPLVDTGGVNTIQADAQGSFSDTFVADPLWLSGTHVLYALDLHTSKRVSVPVLVTGSDALQGPPHLLLSSSTLDFGSGDEITNTNQLLALSNAGGGLATWQASVNQPWLAIAPQSGSIASGKHASAIVTASRASLAPGSYQATILFTSNTGEVSLAVSIKVTSLETGHEAIMQVSPAALAFEGAAHGFEPAERTVTIANPGILPLTWGAKTSGSWLWAAPASGTIPAGGRQQITVGASTDGLASGVYRGGISFANWGSQPVQGAPQSIYVSLTVTSACTLTLSTGHLGFSGEHNGAYPGSQSVRLGVAQGCNINQHWTEMTSNSGWLHVNASRGTTPARVTVSISTSGLGAGTYYGSLTFTSSLGSKTVSVTLNITPVPCSVSKSSNPYLQGTAGQAALVKQSVTLNASGDCSHDLDLTTSVSGGSWLSASSDGSFTTSTAVSIRADLSGLNPGTYNGAVTITVVDSVTDQTIQTLVVPVTLTAQAPPPPATPCALQAPTPKDLSFTANVKSNPTTPTASVTISVTGSCSGNVTITPATDSASNSWLSISDPVTLSSGSSATFTVTIASSSLDAGTYTGTIILNASGDISSQRKVTVTLTVQ